MGFDIMEFYLSKQEYEIIQFAIIAWGAFHCWESIVNFSHKFPHLRAVVHNLVNGQREEPPPPPRPRNDARHVNENAETQHG